MCIKFQLIINSRYTSHLSAKILHISLKIVKRLKKLQLPLETKRKKSDFVIKNNFKNNSAKKSVKIILKKILSNA